MIGYGALGFSVRVTPHELFHPIIYTLTISYLSCLYYTPC